MLKPLSKILSILLVLTLVLSFTACGTKKGSASPSPSGTASEDVSDTASPDESPSDTVSPDESSSDTASPDESPSDTASPDESPSDSASPDASAPKVTCDKTSIASGGTVTFKITTSTDVKQIQTVIDGSAGKKYTDFTSGTDTREWEVKVVFTDTGSRKVQFKCTTESGDTQDSNTKTIKVAAASSSSGTYTATASDKSISAEDTVTFTLATPSTITSVYAVIDDVKQGTVTSASSNSGGVKKWKVTITFHKTGDRKVVFKALTDSTVKKTFPSSAIVIKVS